MFSSWSGLFSSSPFDIHRTGAERTHGKSGRLSLRVGYAKPADGASFFLASTSRSPMMKFDGDKTTQSGGKSQLKFFKVFRSSDRRVVKPAPEAVHTP
jgi:hypothetical protein